MPNPEFTVSRRSFLRRAAIGSISFPFITRGLLANPPSERVRHATFGASGMAWADVTSLASHPAVEVIAAAEVDATRAVEFRKRFPKAHVYTDFRELLDKEKPDSANVSTPDHMHAAIGMSAMRHGINVYGQKPLTHDLFETRRLTEFAKSKRLVTQMGIQIHSDPQYRLAVRLVQDGVIGKVREAHTWSSKEWGEASGENLDLPKPTDPPPTFNWDLWVGICAMRPYLGGGWYHPANWRKRVDFGTGTFGDMGCHIFDPVFAALALTAPVSVRSEGAAPSAHSWATNAIVKYVFPATPYTAPGSVPVTWYDGRQRPPAEVQALLEGARLPDQGSILVGTDGVMVIPHVDTPILHPKAKYAGFKMPEVTSGNHWHQFVNAVRGEGTTWAGFEYSGPLTESVLLGAVATRFPATTLEWNSRRLRFENVAEANHFVRRRYRHGFEVEGL